MYLKPNLEEVKREGEKIEKELTLKRLEKSVDDKKVWKMYHRRATLARKEGFLDHKPPEYLKKGEYRDPWEIHVNLYREDDHNGELFRLYHKPLRAHEKDKEFGMK